MNAEKIIKNCPSCGAKNRVETNRMTDAVCGRCGTPLPASSGPVIVTDSNFDSSVASAELPVLLDLWAAWCGPCRMIAPIIEQLADELSGRVVVGKLDVDANPVTASRFGVQSIPTLLILKDGKEADRLIGLQSKEAILSRLSGFM